MIVKKQDHEADKKVNPFVGIVLFVISIVLIVITGPIGFIYGLFYSLFTRGFKGLGDYFLQIAVSIDQLGNVLMSHLLNLLWVQRNGYKFGNRDETISSAIGRNKALGTLSFLGRAIDAILDVIDRNHSLNSIDYYIEPSDQIIDKLAWIHIVDGQILSTRSKDKTIYYIPGGKREKGETDAQAIHREIKEELSIDLQLPSLQFIGIFEGQADGHKSGTLVRMTCYSAVYGGTLQPNTEIEEMVWLNYKDNHKVSEVDKLLFDFLKSKELLD